MYAQCGFGGCGGILICSSSLKVRKGFLHSRVLQMNAHFLNGTIQWRLYHSWWSHSFIWVMMLQFVSNTEMYPTKCKIRTCIYLFLSHIMEIFLRYRMEAEILEATTQELMMHDYPSDCCPEGCYLKFPCIAGDPDSPFWQGWGNLRIKTFRLIENKYFEMAVITMILISSLALVSVIFISLPLSCLISIMYARWEKKYFQRFFSS